MSDSGERGGPPPAPPAPPSGAPPPSPSPYAPPPSPYAPPPSPSPYATGPSPYAAGPPALCAVHPQTPAVGLCPRCGAYMCSWCRRMTGEGVIVCEACAARVAMGGPVPWDQRPELGLWRAWWRTLKESLIGPDRFFARACHSGHTKTPLLYGSMAVWFGQSWVMLIYFIVGVVLMATTKDFAMGLGFTLGSVIFLTLMAPVSALMQCYVAGGITHLCARLFGGRGSYQASARALGFALGPYAFGIFPYLGGLAGMVTSIVLQVYGMKHAHSLTGGRAAAAVLVPFGVLVLLCCGGYIALIVAAASLH